MLHVYSRSREGDTPLSAHFKAREFACADGSDPIFIDDELVTLLPGRGGIGRYPPRRGRPRGWVHLDVRPTKARWTG